MAFDDIVDDEGYLVEEPPVFDIVLADPPWSYYGDPDKNAAAGKHYNLMSQEELKQLPVRDLMGKKAALFLWATCPRLDYAIELISAWGLHYRGVAWVWVKTRKDGGWIHGQGVPPTFTKPTTELLLAASTVKRGRPFPIQSSKLPQVVEEGTIEPAPRTGKHSEKPARFHELIEELAGEGPQKLELFCRGLPRKGWYGWGRECGVVDEAAAWCS